MKPYFTKTAMASVSLISDSVVALEYLSRQMTKWAIFVRLGSNVILIRIEI